MKTGFIALNTALGSAARTALRFSFSALAKVYLRSWTSAFVKLDPPIGMLRCQMRRPLVTTRSVESTPIETSTSEAGGFSGSIVAGSGSWSNIAMLANAMGAICRISTSMPASWKGASALCTCSRFMANRATSASITKPDSSTPVASRCQSQTT